MGLLQDFLLHNRGNEIPKRHLVWACYGAISATIGRRVYLDIPHLYTVPNLYILIVAKAGERKSSARDKAVDMLIQSSASIVQSGDNDTYQGIITAMEKDDNKVFYMDGNGQRLFYRPYNVFASEFPDYLQNNPLGMVNFLTNIYDRRHYEYRLKNESHVLEFPYVTMLACATPEWVINQVKSSQFQAGYGRRCILACSDGFDAKRPTINQEEIDAWERCVARLKKIQFIHGPMTIESSVENYFWSWYESMMKEKQFDSYMRAWRNSLHVNVLKVAICISLSERDDLVITKDYLDLAIEQFKDIETNLPMVVAMSGRSEQMIPAQSILDFLKAHKGAAQLKLVKLKTATNFKTMTEQWQVLEWLKSTEQVVVCNLDGKEALALPVRIQKEREKTKDNEKDNTNNPQQ